MGYYYPNNHKNPTADCTAARDAYWCPRIGLHPVGAPDGAKGALSIAWRLRSHCMRLMNLHPTRQAVLAAGSKLLPLPGRLGPWVCLLIIVQ